MPDDLFFFILDFDSGKKQHKLSRSCSHLAKLSNAYTTTTTTPTHFHPPSFLLLGALGAKVSGENAQMVRPFH